MSVTITSVKNEEGTKKKKEKKRGSIFEVLIHFSVFYCKRHTGTIKVKITHTLVLNLMRIAKQPQFETNHINNASALTQNI